MKRIVPTATQTSAPVETRKPVWVPVVGLVAVTVVWGATFVTVKEAVEEIPPFEFLTIRFALAWMALALLFPVRLSRLRTLGESLRPGILAGIWLAAGYATQTLGLQRTSATNAGFITGLFVVFTPVVAALWFRKAPGVIAAAGVAIAACGLLLLTWRPQGAAIQLGRGDLLVVITAISFAVHIVVLGRYSPYKDARDLALIQMAVAALIFGLCFLIFEKPVAPVSRSVWFAILLTALMASAGGFLIQTWAQRLLSPTQTAVTLTMEPVFAGIFGYLLLGERLAEAGWIGAVLILSAMLLVDFGDRRRMRRLTTKEIGAK